MAARYEIARGGSGKPGDLVIIDHLAVALERLKPRVDAAAATADLFGRQIGLTAGAVGQFAVALKQAQFGEFALAVGSAARGVSMLQAAATQVVGQLKSLAAAASPTGLQTYNRAWGVLSATIGAVVLPAFTIVGAGAMALADALWQDLKPNAEGLAEKFASFAEAVADAAEAAYDFAKSALQFSGQAAEAAEGWSLKNIPTNAQILFAGLLERMGAVEPGLAHEIANEHAWKRFREDEEDEKRGKVPWPANFPLPGQPGGLKVKEQFDWIGAIRNGLKDMAVEMRQGLGQGPAFTGIAEKWRQVQQTQVSPIQQKLFDRFDWVIRLVDRVARLLDRKGGAIDWNQVVVA